MTKTPPQTTHSDQDAKKAHDPVSMDGSGVVAYSTADVHALARTLTARLSLTNRISYLYAIPNGGTSALPYFLSALTQTGLSLLAEYDPALASRTLVFDDLVDSGKTILPYLDRGSQGAVLLTKNLAIPVTAGGIDLSGRYVTFPWETATGPEDAVRRLLQFMQYDPDSPHLRDTPRRVLQWFSKFTAGKDPDFAATTFDGVTYGGMVLVRDISFVSLCEHHLLPFTGKAAVAYIPNGGTVIGLSKLARFVQHHASRLQVQERMTEEIATSLSVATGSRDVAVLVEARHECMAYRGPEDEHHQTITSSLFGSFHEDASAREEFMMLARR